MDYQIGQVYISTLKFFSRHHRSCSWALVLLNGFYQQITKLKSVGTISCRSLRLHRGQQRPWRSDIVPVIHPFISSQSVTITPSKPSSFLSISVNKYCWHARLRLFHWS
jgi:hypothetical protein